MNTQQGWRASTGGGGSGTDEKVKISSADTTTNFLEDKLVAGANITLNKLNTGANETIEIVASTLASGIIGIPNGSGSYTFYASLTLAMAGAVSGDTIIFFDDYTETSAVQITMTNGVDINLNGNTYTLSSADNTNMFTSGVGAKVTFYNGRLIRVNAVPTTSNTGVAFLIARDVELTFEGVLIDQQSDALIMSNSGTNAKIIGGIYKGGSGTYQYSVLFTSAITLISMYFESIQPISISGATMIDCIIRNSSSGAGVEALEIGNSSRVSNCYVEHTSGTNTSTTIEVTGDSFLRNCTAINRGTGIGMSATSSKIYDCYAESIGGNAFRLLSNCYAKDCSASSPNSSFVYYISQSTLQDCSGFGDSDSRIVLVIRDCRIYNCSFTTQGALATGEIIFVQDIGNKFAQCTLSSPNSATKNGFDGNVGITANIVNTMGDMTSGQLINTTNVTNSQVLTEDGFGNIILG